MTVRSFHEDPHSAWTDLAEKKPKPAILPISLSAGKQKQTNLCPWIGSGGATAAINVSWIHPYKHRELIVVGSSGFIVYDAAKPPAEQLKVVRTEMEVRRGRPTDGAKITGEKNVVGTLVRGEREQTSNLCFATEKFTEGKDVFSTFREVAIDERVRALH